MAKRGSGKKTNRGAPVAIIIVLLILLVGADFTFLRSQGVTLSDFSFKGMGEENEESTISFIESEPESEPVSEPESEPVSSEIREKVELEHPYYIRVDKGAQIVTVFTTNEEGKYEKIVRQMLCSSGENMKKLPDGYYPLKENRKRWGNMFSITKQPCYAQYTTQITGYFLFHSVTYTAKDVNTLQWRRFNKLGTAASGGCIRLTVENAKWIFENCNPGTVVEVCTGTPQPALVKRLQDELGVGKLTAANKYDPTDPEIEGHITQYPDPDPQPDPYAPLYNYNIKFSPECKYTRMTTTTTPTTPAPTNGGEDTPTTTTPAPAPEPEPPAAVIASPKVPTTTVRLLGAFA